jgi:hypothetical protein
VISRANARQTFRRIGQAVLVALLAAVSVSGCGGEPGSDPNIKVEQGKSVQESVSVGSGAKAKQEAAPKQRTKGGPD